MLDYLEQLIKEQKWEEALVTAEQLLLRKENTLADQLRLNLALITARAYLGEYGGIVLLGDHAARMATDLEDWESYLTINHYLGYAYSVLDQWSEAKRAWINFITYVAKYGRDHLFEVITWFHLGIAAGRENDLQAAIDYYLHARRVAERRGNHRQVLGVNQALIDAYTRLGDFSKVPKLLASCASYLRNNRDTDDWDKAWLHHCQVRATFALATRRYRRARLVATRAVNGPNVTAIHQFNLHMILAAVAKNIGTPSEMVDHYLRARVAAIRARRYDFELNAAESLYLFVQSHPDALETSLNELVNREIPLAWFEMDDFPSRRL